MIIKDLFAKMNEKQSLAVHNTEGASLIVAGAGSGKTMVLTARIAYLIENKNIDPYNIIALTFTNKAASEMRERIEKISKKDLSNSLIGTFHSCFAKILRKEAAEIGYTNNFTILDTSDSKAIISRIIKEMNLDNNIYTAENILSKISKCKGEIITAETYKNEREYICEDKKKHLNHFCDIFREYEKKCKEMNAMDFDDLLLNTYILFSKKDVAKKYQERFKYVFIDEFQDTNKLQYAISRLISAKYNNICVVGDDAQSIYGFRGATIQNILDFKNDYKNCDVIKLEQNYRSTQTIVNAANSVIKKNKKQISKNTFSKNVEGEKIQIIKTLTSTEEAKAIALSVESLLKTKHFKSSEIAVLYRTNNQSRLFETEFNKIGIKYKILGGISFYQKKIIKDFLAYLRVIVNPQDEDAIHRSINEPKRGLGGATLEKIYSIIKKNNLGIWDAFVNHKDLFPKKSADLLLNYIKIIQYGIDNLQKKNAYEIAMDICKKTSFLKKLKEKVDDVGKEQYNDICELLDLIKIFVEDNENKDKSLYSFLQDLPINTDRNFGIESKAVSLLSVHSSKGLEFECVYIVGLEEGIFPLFKGSITDKDLEEERRLFYVALTRAKKKVYLSSSKSVLQNGFDKLTKESRFLNEIDEEYLERKTISAKDIKENFSKIVVDYTKYSIFKFSIVNKKEAIKKSIIEQKFDKGSVIYHPQYGRGILSKVINKEQHKMKVTFEKYGEKIIICNPKKIFAYA